MANVLETMHLFTGNAEREQHIHHLLQHRFERVSPQQIMYELKRYGLDVENELVAFDENWWSILREWATFLQMNWSGPQTATYLFPAKSVNAVCFQRCICLFVRAPMEEERLRTLFTHEYNHSCRLANFGLPQTIEDYIVLEGLAQWAVRELHGVEALEHWSTKLSYEETMDIWQQLDMDSILDVYAILFGEEAAFIPSHFGYSLGYRLIEQFMEDHTCSMEELLKIPTERFWNV